MSTLVITRGAPASGKSTWARQWVAEAPESRLRVNRDDLRKSLFNATGGTTTKTQEEMVTRFQHEQIGLGLRNGFDVVSDDTNLTGQFVKKLVAIAKKNGAEVEFEDQFLDVPLSSLLIRDKNRPERVGEGVVRRFHSKAQGAKNTRPGMDVSTDVPVFEPWSPTEGLPSAILVDIDGTVAHNNGHRGFYDESLVGGDDVDPIIARLVADIIDGGRHRVIFMSGRTDGCRAETMIWLEQNVTNLAVGWDVGMAPLLYMRKSGDTRNDAIVKNELFNQHINGKYNVEFILDDRDRVVNMWRAKGLKVLQVQPGDF